MSCDARAKTPPSIVQLSSSFWVAVSEREGRGVVVVCKGGRAGGGKERLSSVSMMRRVSQ